MEQKRVLFVCLGNICRSPAAEGLLAHAVKERGLTDRVIIDSAGTYGGHAGQLPDQRMRMAASKRGYELTHIARQFRTEDFDDFDMIIAMDDRNYDDLQEMAPSPEALEKLWRMVDFNREYDITYVPDPYYEGVEGFEYVLDILEDSTTGLLHYIVDEAEDW